ncbi:PRC-barrel domain-containing protein [Plastoroseomonas hellenica]|uniref:PRC-barrel domain-containing protein n=1 Tax=Plastoroseomonas hellenica TaxID=2687306 RepID=UPI001BAA4016|nr:PRC-barrel domain-containing protein [Plastoroseomonas hellenica]MBR0644664.1 PRC-barrel domain containing protein [Plastoroseomonas hellenica]
MQSPARLAIPLAALLATGLAPGMAAAQHGVAAQAPDGLTPEQRMQRRFPQPARVGDLIGLPLLDADDRTIGRVERVVRTAEGRILLVARRGAWFGIGGELVPVPIETVAMLGAQIAVLDIPRGDFLTLAAWRGDAGTPIGPDAIIRVAITRR